MTRKQYDKKMIQFHVNCNKYAKRNGLRTTKQIYKHVAPKWGTVIMTGRHKGEALRSYKQAWELMEDTLTKTGLLDGIK